MEGSRGFENPGEGALDQEKKLKKALQMGSYLMSEEYKERMKTQFNDFVRRTTSLKNMEDWVVPTYEDILEKDQEKDSPILEVVQTYGTATAELTRSALEAQIIDRIVNDELKRRKKALGENSEAARNIKVSVEEIFNEFFTPLETLDKKLDEADVLVAETEKLLEDLKILRGMRVPGVNTKDRIKELEKEFNEKNRKLKALTLAINEAKHLEHFVPGVDKELELFQKENPKDGIGSFMKIMLGKAYQQFLERRSRARTKKYEEYGYSYLAGEDPIEMLVDEEKRD